MKKKAVVLLSGGMDSAVTLYMAREEYQCHVLMFDYGQKAVKELDFARKIAEEAGCSYRLLKIDLPWKGSSLLDGSKEVPEAAEACGESIPDTYVPARNMIFLSYGISFAEAIGADAVFIGAHQLDYSNYPDCRSGFFDAFSEAVRKGTKSGVEKSEVKVVTPIINMTKKEIVCMGNELGVPFEYTWSCYEQDSTPCGKCESCVFRMKAFEEAGIQDPLMSRDLR
jgi:7-cyano-7-deazaguanine synthase